MLEAEPVARTVAFTSQGHISGKEAFVKAFPTTVAAYEPGFGWMRNHHAVARQYNREQPRGARRPGLPLAVRKEPRHANDNDGKIERLRLPDGREA